jgi:hypothetical protein
MALSLSGTSRRTRLQLALSAAGILAVGIVTGLALGHRAADEPPAAADPPPASSLPGDSGAVRANMRGVHYRIFHDVALEISFLQGALTPTRSGRPASFDDPTSFNIAIDTARITLDTTDLSGLLNQFVFRYHGAALRDLHAGTEGGRLRLHGKIHKVLSLPFTIIASVRVTPAGVIRLHPDEVRLIGIGVKGLLGALSVELDDLIRSNRLHGVTVAGNELELDPTELLPPPRIRGRLRALLVESGALVQVFGRREREPAFEPVPPLGRASIAFRGGRLQFGKLTMSDADMRIIRSDSSGRFDFFLDHYLLQLVAGYHTTTPDNGLDVVMPDFVAAERGARRHGPP